MRSLQGKLRIGLAAKSVLVAVVQALVLTPPDAQNPPRLVNRYREGAIRGAALKTLLEESVALVKEVRQERYCVLAFVDHKRKVYSEVPSYETMLPILLNTTDVPHGETIKALVRGNEAKHSFRSRVYMRIFDARPQSFLLCS